LSLLADIAVQVAAALNRLPAAARRGAYGAPVGTPIRRSGNSVAYRYRPANVGAAASDDIGRQRTAAVRRAILSRGSAYSSG
jgi:hypothetical protein